MKSTVLVAVTMEKQRWEDLSVKKARFCWNAYEEKQDNVDKNIEIYSARRSWIK